MGGRRTSRAVKTLPDPVMVAACTVRPFRLRRRPAPRGALTDSGDADESVNAGSPVVPMCPSGGVLDRERLCVGVQGRKRGNSPCLLLGFAVNPKLL